LQELTVFIIGTEYTSADTSVELCKVTASWNILHEVGNERFPWGM